MSKKSITIILEKWDIFHFGLQNESIVQFSTFLCPGTTAIYSFSGIFFSIIFCCKNLNSFCAMKFHENEGGRNRNCVRKRLYSSPIFFFFADNVAAFTEDPADTLHLSWTQFYLLNASNIVLPDPPFCYPAANCPVSFS